MSKINNMRLESSESSSHDTSNYQKEPRSPLPTYDGHKSQLMAMYSRNKKERSPVRSPVRDSSNGSWNGSLNSSQNLSSSRDDSTSGARSRRANSLNRKSRRGRSRTSREQLKECLSPARRSISDSIRSFGKERNRRERSRKTKNNEKSSRQLSRTKSSEIKSRRS